MIGLVAGMGAMTYARYISTGTHADQATAAKWGFVVNVDTSKLFSTDYVQDGDYSKPTANDAGVAINAANQSLAPGSTGSLTVSVSGSAEVLAELVISLYVTKNIHLDTYYPVKWSLATQTGSNTPVAVDGATGLALDAFQAKLATLSRTINAGDSLDVKYVISWAWDFNGDNSDEAEAASIKDTLIGYKAQGALYENLANALAPNVTYYQEHITEANYGSASYLSYTLAFTFTATVQQIQAVPQQQ